MTATKKTRTAAEQAAHRAALVERLARHATDADLDRMVTAGQISLRMADEARAARPEPTKGETAAATIMAGAYLLLREDAEIREAADWYTAEEFAAWCATSPTYRAKFEAAVRRVAAAAEATR